MALSSRVRSRLLVIAALALVCSSGAAAASAELDYTTPVLASATRSSPDVVGAGATVSIAYSAYDDGTGLAHVNFEFTGPLGNRFDAQTAWRPATEGVAVGTIPEWAPSGVYKLREVQLRDNGDLFASYQPNGAISKSPYEAIGETHHNLDLAALDFTVVNAKGDALSPLLLSVARTSPDTAVPGDKVTLDFDVADLGSGVDHAGFHYAGPVGLFHAHVASYFASEGKPATWRIRDADPAGFYRLMEVEVTDKAGNRLTYNRDGTVETANGALAPTTHHIDFAPSDVTIVNDHGDSDAPVLQSVQRVSKEVVQPGDTVSIDFTVSEAGWMSMWWDGPLGKTLISRDEGYWPLRQVHVTIPQSAPSGTYKLRMAYAEDNAGYTIEFYRDGRVVNRSGANAPTSHAVDFAPADFIVDNGPLPTTTTTTTAPPTTTTTAAPTTTTTASPPAVANQAPTARGRVAKLSAPSRTFVVDGGVSTDPDGSVVHYMWFWGDGSRSFTRRAWHTYAHPGTYLVRLVIVDDDGATATAAAPIRVS